MQPLFSDSDGVETASTIKAVNQTNDTLTLLATFYWHTSYSFDPEVSILLFPSASGASSDNLMPLWALSALILVIPGCIALLGGLYCGVRWARWKYKARLTEKQVNFTYSLLSEAEQEGRHDI